MKRILFSFRSMNIETHIFFFTKNQFNNYQDCLVMYINSCETRDNIPKICNVFQ